MKKPTCDHLIARWEFNPSTRMYTLRCSKYASHILETLTEDEWNKFRGTK